MGTDAFSVPKRFTTAPDTDKAGYLTGILADELTEWLADAPSACLL